MATVAAGGDPRSVIDQEVMNYRQWIVVAIMVLLNALDGFDVLSSAFAAPGISAEWGIARSTLGVVLSAELVGMGIGSVILGGIADRLGRKPAMMICLALMVSGMFLCAEAGSVTELTVWRLLTGLGIGGMLAATNAMTAESTNLRWRSVALSAYVAGYPIGAVVGGIVAQNWLLAEFDWRAVFLFGAIVTGVMIPVVWFLVPESAAFQYEQRRPDALARINRTLRAYAKIPLQQLASLQEGKPSARLSDLFLDAKLRLVTLLLGFGFVFHMFTFYFVLKWGVQVVADFPPGYSPADAASILTMTSLGGVLGSFGLGFFIKRFGLRWPSAIALILTSLTTVWFGMGHSELTAWQFAAFCYGIASHAAITGFYTAFATSFPTSVRATGTGFVIGIGRIGAASSPIAAGVLFDIFGKSELLFVASVIAIGSTFALVLFLRLPQNEVAQPTG
ncbi:MAG: MFS transporter [Erythrobacter sp.]